MVKGNVRVTVRTRPTSNFAKGQIALDAAKNARGDGGGERDG